MCDTVSIGIGYRGFVTPSIVSVSTDSVAACVVNSYNVTEKIALEVVGVSRTGNKGMYHADYRIAILEVN